MRPLGGRSDRFSAMASPVSSRTRAQTMLNSKPTSDFPQASSPILDRGSIDLLSRIQNILEEKAPEGIPLLEAFLGRLPFLCSNSVEADKRQRSVVFYGVPEAEKSLPPSQRQLHTEKYISDVLDFLEVEAGPTELFRMGTSSDGRPRLVKCIFSSRRFQLETLSRSSRLRTSAAFKTVFVRKSMTREQRAKESELRRRAHDLNTQEFGGKRLYVVYKGEITKTTDIESRKVNLGSSQFRSVSGQ